MINKPEVRETFREAWEMSKRSDDIHREILKSTRSVDIRKNLSGRRRNGELPGQNFKTSRASRQF